MMSTSRASRPSKDKTKTQLQNVKSDGQPKNQATAEQMRIAELIQDKMSGADPEVKAKISQVIDVTGRSVDEALVALHDCDNDPNRAINMLLEGEADQGEWQESGKKKKKQVPIKPEISPNNKNERGKSEDRQDDKIHEKDRDRESLPPRRGKQPPRLARKMRESEENERNRNESGSRDRGFERGRGRGRGQANGAGRGRGRGRRGDRGGGGNRFDRSQGPAIGTWTNETAENAEKENSSNTWDGMGEDWGDEWTGSLEETKVFTATNTSKVFEDTSKVFNSNDSSNVFNSNESKVFSSNESSKVFGTGMGDNDAKMFQVPGHSDSLETQVFSASMSSMSNSNPAGSALNDSTNTLHTSTSLQNSISQNSLGQPSSLGQRLDLGMLLQKPSSTDRESSSQQQSQFMTQFTKHATEMLKNDLRIGSNSSSHAPTSGGGEPVQPTAQTASSNKTQSVGMKQKPQKSKLPPPSKIPASAVEMPGHLGGNFQLDVQFGNWDFNTGDSGFTFGGSSGDSTSGVSSNFSSTPNSVTTSSSPLSSHGLSNKSGSDSSVMTTMSTVVTTKPSVTGLDSIAQNSAQSSRANMYPNSNSTTPSKEYPPSNKMSPPAAIPYPSGQSDRKMSPHYSQRPTSSGSSSSHMSQSKQGSSPANLAYSQNNYTTSYQSTSFQSSGKPSPTSSYSHSANTSSLGNSGLSSQNQYNHSSYQPASFQSQNAFSPSQQSLGHYSSGQSNTYQGQGSYQGQSSAYHSRDQPSSNAYQNSNSQSASYQGSSQNSSYNSGSSQSGSYQRDSQSGPSAYSSHQNYSSSGHQNSLQSSSMSNKLNDSLNKMSLKEAALDSHQSSSQYDHSNSTNSPSLTTSSSSTTVNSMGSNSANVSTALGLTTTVGASPVTTTSSSSKTSLPMTTSKAPPNLPPGVPPIISHNYMLAGQPGMPFAFANLAAQGLAAQQPAMYSYEDLQLLQQRLPMPPTTLSRDQGLTNVPYSDGKLSRMEAQSPTVQTSQQQQQQTAQQQQQFINPTLPPGYNYYYAGGMVPGGYSYTPTVFPVPPVTNAAHAGSTGNPQFQKPGAFTGSHAYGTGYDDLSSQPQDFSKTYGASAQTQNKGSGSVAVTSATSDISAAAYGKTHTQSFDKTGFPGGTPPPFNMLPTGSQGGPLGAPAAYGTTYVPVMAHQAHSQMLHHHLQQDSTGGSSRGSQQTATQAKAAASKSYGPYWGGS